MTAAALLAVLASCGPGEPPVARLEIDPQVSQLDFSERRTVRLAWDLRRAIEGAEGDLNVFVHLLDEPGEVLRTFDHPFPEKWTVGRRVEYDLPLHQSALGPPLGPGTYSLSIGLYDDSGRRWPLTVAGDEIDDAEYVIGQIRVGNTTSAPMVRFSESWKPIEAGADRQVLGRRWLTDHGTIALSEVAEPGMLWLSIVVPGVDPGVRRLVIDPGYQGTRVLVRNACGGSEIELTGEGRHEIAVPVTPPQRAEAGEGESSTCEIGFEPNFHLVTPGTPDRRAILLETLAWSAGPAPGSS